jgi:phospholipid/cholesterol/gamma-HCH transport system permease protein
MPSETTRIEGALDRTTVGPIFERLASGPADVALDLSAIDHVDSAGVALLSELDRRLQERGGSLTLTGLSESLRETLDIFPSGYTEPGPPTVPRGFGLTWASVVELVRLFADSLWFLAEGLLRPRRMRWQSVVYEMSNMGAGALAVVGVIMFLIGATLALLSAAQLRQFGATLYIADLVGISIVKEIGPLMAAIVVAGRSGSAVAAEVGTMVITEEIDALKIMGIQPVRFLITPKVLAILLTLPLLTVYGMLLGILGGLLVAVTYLELAVDPYFNRVANAILLGDFVGSLIKSLVFALLIVMVGAWCGFATSGGADAVGRSTTQSVVNCIFAIIAADAVANVILVMV